MIRKLIFAAILLYFPLACHENSSAQSKKTTIEVIKPHFKPAQYSPQQLRQGVIKTAQGKKIKITIAHTAKEQEVGLSGVFDEKWKADQGMLFFYHQDGYRRFWMPNTFFNLDIFFLDKDLRVLDIHRNLQHFTESGPYPLVPQSKTVYCRHVLEMKNSSDISREIKPGDKLKWISEPNLWQIELNTRQER